MNLYPKLSVRRNKREQWECYLGHYKMKTCDEESEAQQWLNGILCEGKHKVSKKSLLKGTI